VGVGVRDGNQRCKGGMTGKKIVDPAGGKHGSIDSQD
jgi:hypothetical protein